MKDRTSPVRARRLSWQGIRGSAVGEWHTNLVSTSKHTHHSHRAHLPAAVETYAFLRLPQGHAAVQGEIRLQRQPRAPRKSSSAIDPINELRHLLSIIKVPSVAAPAAGRSVKDVESLARSRGVGQDRHICDSSVIASLSLTRGQGGDHHHPKSIPKQWHPPPTCNLFSTQKCTGCR